jgi:uncharacterized damage-inducible protein DinB
MARETGGMTMPFPAPTTSPGATRAEVFTGYLDFFRSRLVTKLLSLPPQTLRSSLLPSGWTPIELLKHLRYVELRWLEWGFEGRDVGNPWADEQDGRWFAGPRETLAELLDALHAQAERTTAIVSAHDLAEIGQPGERWDGAEPASLERVLLHLLQEYARHLGQLDVVSELAGGEMGE